MNSLKGASHALLASLGSCARRIEPCGVSFDFFRVLPYFRIQLDFLWTL